jgi:protein tyrosine phosphatase (PTP) superfamily phosphohydrolase (DUF442 family)
VTQGLLAPLVDVAGLALGLLIALVLAHCRRGNRSANRWLAAYAAALALLSFGDLVEDARWALAWPHMCRTG